MVRYSVYNIMLLEEMNQGIKMIGEQYGTIVNRLDNIESTLGQHTQELQIIKATTQTNNSELKSVKMAVMEVDVKVNKLEKRTERIEQKLDTNISQNEGRFKRIEEKIEVV